MGEEFVRTSKGSIIVQPQNAFYGFEITNTGTLCGSTSNSEPPRKRNVCDAAWIVVTERYLSKLCKRQPQGRFDWITIMLTVLTLSLLRSKTLPMVRPSGPARTRLFGKLSDSNRHAPTTSCMIVSAPINEPLNRHREVP